MRISDWSSDVCSSDLAIGLAVAVQVVGVAAAPGQQGRVLVARHRLADTELHGGELCLVESRVHGMPPRLRTTRPRRKLIDARGGLPPGRAGRKRVVSGKSGSVRVDLGVRRLIKKKNT